MLLLLMTIDKEECQTVNTQKHDNYHKISQAKAKAKAKDLDPNAKDLDFGLKDQGQGQGLTSLPTTPSASDSFFLFWCFINQLTYLLTTYLIHYIMTHKAPNQSGYNSWQDHLQWLKRMRAK